MLKTKYIEIALQKPKSAYNLDDLKENLIEFIKNLSDFQTVLEINPEIYPDISKSVKKIIFDEDLQYYPNNYENINFYFYYPYHRSFEEEMIDSADDEDETCASNHWILPNKEFEGLYESLIYDDDVKKQILKFSESAIIFGNYNVDKNLISCNRLILLHGPPGTGKTSLCKAIVQKLSIRLNSLYKFTHFVEVNSHSLFSKWFSESGKLVSKLFAKIREMIMQPDCLVCILIDEVESIAYNRCDLSGEPKDALRVVNAVLTQLDQLKYYSNVMIFATSNLIGTIDLAFVDRVDLKKFIGFPGEKAIYNIYLSAVNDLIKVGLIKIKQQNDNNILEANQIHKTEKKCNKFFDENSISLFEDAVKSSLGLSGRILRKMPFLAHTYIEHLPDHLTETSLERFLNCLLKAIQDHNSSTLKE